MAEPNTATVEAPAASVAGPDAGLDNAISALEARLPELQRGANPLTEQSPSRATTSTTQEAAAPTEQPAASAAQEPGGDEDIDEGIEQLTEPGKPLSRMGRLRQQLTQTEERSRTLEQQLQQREQAHNNALRQFVDLVLPDATFEALRIQAEGGDWEAKQQLDKARMWRQMVAPLHDVAQHAARQQFDTALADLRTLDGMDGDSHQKLLTASTPGDKVKLAWDLGRKAADGAHKERIAALEAEVQALKTNRAANGAQPANGGTPGGSASGFAGLVARDGLLTDEAMNLTPDEIRARFVRRGA